MLKYVAGKIKSNYIILVYITHSDGDTEFFDIVAGVLQGDTLFPYLFIICLDYVLRTSIDKIRENGFELTKKRGRRYPHKNNYRHTDYADDISLLANTPNQTETLQPSFWTSQFTQNWIYVL